MDEPTPPDSRYIIDDLMAGLAEELEKELARIDAKAKLVEEEEEGEGVIDDQSVSN